MVQKFFFSPLTWYEKIVKRVTIIFALFSQDVQSNHAITDTVGIRTSVRVIECPHLAG